MYKRSKSRDNSDTVYIHCQNDGNWTNSNFNCEQTCGTIGIKVAFSVNSQVTEVQKVPWQVGIYMGDSNGIYHHICGGTLVKSNVIISAAHCFWDPLETRLYNESNYIVAAGKFYRDFYSRDEPLAFQMSDVSNIKIPSQFSGADYDYVSDVAVVTLKNHILFKNHIRPACLPWNLNEEIFILNNKHGVVAGWGITNTGSYSPELRSVELTAVDSDDCKRKVTRNNKIPNDKFCVDTDEGRNVCRGDSGGGFLVPIYDGDVAYYYLWGVVSNGLINPGSGDIICNSKFVTTFTNLQLYQGFVTQLKIFHRDDEYDIGCLVPEKVSLLLRNIETDRFLIPGSYVEKNTKIRYVCPVEYLRFGNHTTNTCDKDWLNPHPECIRACTQLYFERSIIARCYYKGKQIYCNRRRLRPGTIAKIECAYMYQKPHNKLFHETITCTNNGFWDNLPTQCEQICGTTEPKLKTEANNTELIFNRTPWQVSIYYQDKNVLAYKYICSGTLIHSKIVLSLIYCFWNSKNSALHDLSNYMVTVGNFYRDYYTTINETQEIQALNISKIYVPDSFTDETGDDAFPIAVILLYYHVVFRNHVRPACLILEANNSINEKLGVIADWRVNNEGVYSSELCSIDLFHKNNPECSKNSSISKTEHEKHYCLGDNGRGLLIPKTINNTIYYHLLGIISNNLAIQGNDSDECDSKFRIVTFNNVSNFKSDLMEILKNATQYIILFE
ncbi:modular serine protease-like [Condylostylus longicornis]|uniref:modular serine protease-like n=1 Tax=Condylostylus longicornis TaxID=2530218 RepID=UPI00244D9AC3|nr:modular serine protease-like [Condylostylus longicornis]